MSDETINQENINIETIMQSIREQIMAERGAVTTNGEPIVNLLGKRLPPEFYDHLYQVGMDYNQLHIPLQLTATHTPLLGSLIHKFRLMIHEVVLFYVNQLAVKQSDVNLHLLRAISILGQEVEKLAEETETTDKQR